MRLFQASGAFHYDLVEIDRARLTDLDLGQIGQYFTRHSINFFEESEAERLRLMFYSDILGERQRPTLSGLLLFGMAPERLLPQSGVSFAHFAGSKITADLVDKKTIGGALPQQVEGTLAAIKINLLTPSTIIGAKRIDTPPYPDRVLREWSARKRQSSDAACSFWNRARNST
ncbi:DNA helicase-related protein [Candidatus Vecturithrix granuli]|uniref:DNA helicase-related protein n=1 Tax=Vecturithrix granuli TaxID=1499967 RepID=A0A081BW66_VECG1|nr:DNA helicase-related protein [Candidatus Vecturithrix granuli]